MRSQDIRICAIYIQIPTNYLPQASHHFRMPSHYIRICANYSRMSANCTRILAHRTNIPAHRIILYIINEGIDIVCIGAHISIILVLASLSKPAILKCYTSH